jgi:hypothetical protein
LACFAGGILSISRRLTLSREIDLAGSLFGDLGFAGFLFGNEGYLALTLFGGLLLGLAGLFGQLGRFAFGGTSFPRNAGRTPSSLPFDESRVIGGSFRARLLKLGPP